jgi:putative ABC transport system permease protein
MAVSPDPGVFRDATARLALADDIKRTFEAHPGVRRTAVMAGVLPPWYDDTIDVTLGPDVQVRDVGRHAVEADYFDVMNMSIRHGRGFELSDRAAGASSAIVSESFARRLAESSGREALGQRLQASMPDAQGTESIEIVGVVNDVLYNGPLRARPADLDVYVPLERGGLGALSIAIHTDVDATTLIGPLSRELGRLAPSSPQHWISTMQAEMGLQYQDARLYASLSGIYGGAAMLLAVLGIYSVLANNVARRRRELGVRVAVGAQSSDILRLILSEGARTLAVGIVFGVGLSLAAARLLTGLLYGVLPGDPLTFTVVGASLLDIGLCAALVPSFRAARVDPIVALRAE